MSFTGDNDLIELSLKIIEDTVKQQTAIIRECLQRMKEDNQRHVWLVQNDKNGQRPEDWH